MSRQFQTCVSQKDLIQFLSACKMTSPTDQRNNNVRKIDFLHKISEYCVFSAKFQLLLKLKFHVKPIFKMVCIKNGN